MKCHFLCSLANGVRHRECGPSLHVHALHIAELQSSYLVSVAQL